MYLRAGAVNLTVVNKAGKEAVVEILGPGDFFGVRCLAGKSVYTATQPRLHLQLYSSLRKKR